MNFSSSDTPRLPLALVSFGAGLLVFALAAGYLTGGHREALEREYDAGVAAGIEQTRQDSPSLIRESASISLISSATFVESLEIELKSISSHTNAIEIVYGEIGRERILVPALNVGDAIARDVGNTLYIIKHVSVAANLQRATLEVTRIKLPPQPN